MNKEKGKLGTGIKLDTRALVHVRTILLVHDAVRLTSVEANTFLGWLNMSQRRVTDEQVERLKMP